MLKIDQKQNIISYIKNSKNKTVSSVSYENVKDANGVGYSHIDLDDDFKFQLAPRPLNEIERSVLFVAGESGAGKSYYVREYAKEYNKMFSKNPIYLISYLEKDETLDDYKKIIRINAFNPEFLEECMDIKLEEFSNSMIIFDDIDSITQKNVKAKIYGFLNKMLRLGRHENITVCCCMHELYASPDIKQILNEAHIITFFPKFLNFKKMNYLLEVYFGLSKNNIQKIKDIEDSRFISYMKGHDKIILTENQVYILNKNL